MNILIVEDDENKLTQLTGFLSEYFPPAKITTARSLHSGLRAIVTGGLDLILLDMTMPTFDIGIEESGGRPQIYAGREIILQMKRRGITTPVIVITQFDKFGVGEDELTLKELNERLSNDHPQSYQGVAYYSASFSGWKNALSTLISKLSTVKGDIKNDQGINS